jgi:hypothetical protein
VYGTRSTQAFATRHIFDVCPRHSRLGRLDGREVMEIGCLLGGCICDSSHTSDPQLTSHT